MQVRLLRALTTGSCWCALAAALPTGQGFRHAMLAARHACTAIALPALAGVG